MPTLHKPIVNDLGSVWSSDAAKAISDGVQENRTKILTALNFHKEHGRLGEMEGKYDSQIMRAEDEVLAEITGILTLAAAQAAEPKIGVAIATLNWIKKNPSSAQDHTLPGFAEWLLAVGYQRGEEKKGTYFPDIMGFEPDGFGGKMEIPEGTVIVNAASAAISYLEGNRFGGRPASAASSIVAEGLGQIFLRYNQRITRHSEITSRDGRILQIEGGPFFEFVCVTILPLQTFLVDRNLGNIAASSIVHKAVTQFPP